MLRARQIKAARALLGWRQDQLAAASGLGIATIRRIELTEDSPKGLVGTLQRIQEALEDAGISFIQSDRAGGVGVRLTNPDSEKKRSKARAKP